MYSITKNSSIISLFMAALLVLFAFGCGGTNKEGVSKGDKDWWGEKEPPPEDPAVIDRIKAEQDSIDNLNETLSILGEQGKDKQEPAEKKWRYEVLKKELYTGNIESRFLCDSVSFNFNVKSREREFKMYAYLEPLGWVFIGEFTFKKGFVELNNWDKKQWKKYESNDRSWIK